MEELDELSGTNLSDELSGARSVGNKAAFLCIFGPLPDGGQAQRGGAVHDQADERSKGKVTPKC